jgi:GAF domain-containing protein
VITDTQTSDLVPPADRPASGALGVIACMGVPLLKEGRLVGALCVTASRPRAWQGAEEALLREVGERVWAVTLRARAEEALRESEARLRALSRASSEVFYVMGPDWTEMRELSGGGFLADTTGPSRAWLLNYIPAEDQRTVTAAIDEAIRTRSVFELEHRVRRVDASVGWTFSRAVPILGPGGEIVEWFGAASDITARKEAEARQAFLLTLTDAIRPRSDAAEILTIATRMVRDYFQVDHCFCCEREADTVTIRHGAPPEGWLSGSAADLLVQTLVSRSGSQGGQPMVARDVLTSNAVDASLQQLCHSAGISAYISVPIFTDNELVGSFCLTQRAPRTWTDIEIELIREITERTWAAAARARAEAALRALNATLEAQVEERTHRLADLNSELRALAAASFHELSEPLRRLRGVLQLLERRTTDQLDDQMQRYIRMIHAEVQRAEGLAENLTALARLQNRELNMSPVALTPLLVQVRSDLAPALGTRTGKWNVGVLPVVVGDVLLLRQAFTELLYHALKFVTGTSVAHVEVSAQPSLDAGGSVTVTVAPVTGQAADLDGVGLITVRRMMERHGWTLTVEARDRDAHFVVHFPS